MFLLVHKQFFIYRWLSKNKKRLKIITTINNLYLFICLILIEVNESERGRRESQSVSWNLCWHFVRNQFKPLWHSINCEFIIVSNFSGSQHVCRLSAPGWDRTFFTMTMTRKSVFLDQLLSVTNLYFVVTLIMKWLRCPGARHGPPCHARTL